MATAVQRARHLFARVVAEVGPPPKPIRFRADLPDESKNYAELEDKGRYFLLRFWSGFGDVGDNRPEGWRGLSRVRLLARGLLEEMFIHEIAHAYAWNDGALYRGDHEEIWGVTYARIYCAVTRGH